MKLRKKRKYLRPKTKLGFPDLEQAKAAVVASLPSLGSQREYGRSIDEFIAWYCSEPRLSFSKPWSLVFECTGKSDTSPRPRSISGWLLCGAWHMKPLIRAC